MNRITVYGAGAWGTALALTLEKKGIVTLLARREDHAHWMRESRTNEHYLPGCLLPNSIQITADKSVLAHTDILLWVIPTQNTAFELEHLPPLLPSHVPIVICSKGIVVNQEGPSVFLTNIMAERVQNPLAVLSGPNFAMEIGRGLPAAATLAAFDGELAENLAYQLRHENFRIYASSDPIGVQVAGAIKNVLAIGCGIVMGKNLGLNANAALITRGLAEMRRLGVALGASVETFLGLSSVGDLILTCSSEQSRNTSLGMALAQGNTLEDILSQRITVSEGVYTAKAVHHIAKALSVPMPICEGVYSILYEAHPLDTVIQSILAKQTNLEVF